MLFGDRNHRKILKAGEQPLAIVAITALLLSAALYVWRIWLLRTVAIDRDEFEHLHAAWCLWRGLIPYRDFFEHHTPLLWMMLAPLYRFYPVDQSPDAAVAFIFMARRIMMLIAGICLILTFVLARLWRGERVAWIATAMLSACVAFVYKTLEVRPDVPAAALWLGCLAAGLKAFDTRTRRRRTWLFFLSGFLLGAALMCTQKILVVLPLFALAMLWYLVGGEGSRWERLAECLWQFGGFSVPILAVLAFFEKHGAFSQFLYYNFLANFGWNSALPFPGLISSVFRENPILISLGTLGIVLEGWRRFRDGTFTPDKFLLLATIGAIAGLRLLPEAWLQYYLIFMPLLAIYGADLLSSAIDKGVQLGGVLASSAPVNTLGNAVLAAVLVASSVHPIMEMREHFDVATNSWQLSQLHWVLTHTQPNDTVLDCTTGLGVFRPDAYFYSMLYPQMLSASDHERLIADLKSGRLAPKLIFPDQYLLVPADLIGNYAPVIGEWTIWIRRPQPQ